MNDPIHITIFNDAFIKRVERNLQAQVDLARDSSDASREAWTRRARALLPIARALADEQIDRITASEALDRMTIGFLDNAYQYLQKEGGLSEAESKLKVALTDYFKQLPGALDAVHGNLAGITVEQHNYLLSIFSEAVTVEATRLAY